MRNRYRKMVRSFRDERTCAIKSRPIVRVSCVNGTLRRENVQWT